MDSTNDMVILSVITLKDRQFNLLVQPKVATETIEQWATGKRDDRAAITFLGSNLDMPEHVGMITFPTAMIAHIWQYSRAEYDAREKAVREAQARAAGAGTN